MSPAPASGGRSSASTGGPSSGPKKMTCPTCGYATALKARFTKHVKYHSMPFIKCEFCDFKTQYTWNLDRHMKNHDGQGSMVCPLCNFSCDMKQSLTSHLQNHHNNVPDHVMAQFRSTVTSPGGGGNSSSPESKGLFTKKFYKCRLCEFNALSENGLKCHVSQAHQSQKSMPSLRPMPSLIPIPSSSQHTNSQGEEEEEEEEGNGKEKVAKFLSPEEKELREKVEFLTALGLSPATATGEEDVKEKESEVEAKLSCSSRVQRVGGRRTSFFEKLSKKLQTSSSSNPTSSSQSNSGTKVATGTSHANPSIIISNSTRCQYCRHRCKSSADLTHHLLQCQEAWNQNESPPPAENEEDSYDGMLRSQEESGRRRRISSPEEDEGSLLAPPPPLAFQFLNLKVEAPPSNSTSPSPTKVRNVYKCPQKDCNFWATTASRFHVHIVGHYNTKPFECSECSYRSNWRWDITKHIRLKTIRDPKHIGAKAVLTHESGERNYRKYDRYLVEMEVPFNATDSKVPDCSTVASKLESRSASPSLLLKGVPPPPHSSMPKLKKAPTIVGSGVVSTLIPPLQPAVSISPIFSEEEGRRRIVTRKMFSGGEVLMDSGKRKVYPEISISQIPPEPLPKQEEPKYAYKCKRCQFRHPEKSAVLHHVSQVHKRLNNNPDFGGNENSSIASNNSILASELARPPMLLWKNGQSLSVLRCRFCPQVFISSQDLSEHEETHEGGGGESWSDTEGALNLSLKPSPSPSHHGSNRNLPFQSHQPSSPTQNLLFLCKECPARFLYEKELRIHHTFHERRNEFQCPICSYSARQEVPHLMSHMKVHTADYQERTESLLTEEGFKVAPKVSFGSQGHPSMYKFSPVSILPIGAQQQRSMTLDPTISCPHCPAKFSTMASYGNHVERHGTRTRWPCSFCDFGADSRDNLMFHSILHAGSELTIEPDRGEDMMMMSEPPEEEGEDGEMMIDEEGVKEEEEGQMDMMLMEGDQIEEGEVEPDLFSPNSAVFLGNPEFQYPTYVKNGRVRSKRYKCFKCPSAFEKRDQYRVHMGLHGSDQRYKCTVCDYSVTYYANFIQHLKKHENQPNVRKEQLVATPLSKKSRKGNIGHLEGDKRVPPLVLKVPNAKSVSLA